jgi:hypothetical protein
VTQTQKELVVQAFALSGNKSQVVRDIGLSRPTVIKILREAETNRELQKARTTALESLAGRVHGKTIEIMDSIGPQDLESGLELHRNTEGKVTRAVHWGPSLMQKVTSAAILTDKIKIIEETKAAINADTGNGDPGSLPLPGSVQESLRLLGRRIKRIRAFDIQFESKQPELSQKIQDTVAAAAVHPDVEDADYEEITMDSFDNPTSAGDS